MIFFGNYRRILTVGLVLLPFLLRADYIPDPIMFMHGMSSSLEGDWRQGSSKFYENLGNFYPTDQKNVFGGSIKNVREHALEWAKQFAVPEFGEMPINDSSVSTKLSFFEDAKRRWMFLHPPDFSSGIEQQFPADAYGFKYVGSPTFNISNSRVISATYGNGTTCSGHETLERRDKPAWRSG